MVNIGEAKNIKKAYFIIVDKCCNDKVKGVITMKVRFKFINDKKKGSRLQTYVNHELYADFSANKDENGHKFGYVPNIFAYEIKSENKKHRHSIKDMVEHIRNGYADTITISNFFVTLRHLVRYEDRYYGELIRYQTLQTFKDVKFGYCINVNTSRDKFAISKENGYCGSWSWKNIMSFESREKAELYIRNINDKIKSLYAKYGNHCPKSELDKLNDIELDALINYDYFMDKDKDTEYTDPDKYLTITDCIIEE